MSADYKIAYAIKEPALASKIEMILTKDGYDVVAFSTASALSRVFARHRPRIVLTDAHFDDGFGGEQLCEFIRSQYLLPYVYVTVVARSGAMSDIEHALAIGADDYLVKPFNPLHIRARVRVAQKWVAYLDSILVSGSIGG